MGVPACQVGLALGIFASIIEIGERFRDRDLVILGRQAQGRTLVAGGRVEDGIALFDEIMVPVFRQRGTLACT